MFSHLSLGDVEERVGVYNSFQDTVRMVAGKEVLFEGIMHPISILTFWYLY